MSWIKKGIIFNKHWAQLPVIDVYPDYYKIYYSTRDHLNRSVPKWVKIDKNTFQVIEYAEIGILNFGKPGSFDSHGVMPSSIVTLKNGIKYMYYVGWSKRLDVPYWNSTGLAISEDGGERWSKFSEGPVLSSGPDDPNFIGTVHVEKYPNEYGGEQFDMFYSSCRWEEIEGKQEPIYDIRRAHSHNGRNWHSTWNLIVHLTDNEGGIASFREFKDRFYFSLRKKFDYRTNPNNSYHIKSIDLNIEDEQLELAPDGDELMCAYPYLVEEKDKIIMFYNSDFGSKGISCAIKYK